MIKVAALAVVGSAYARSVDHVESRQKMVDDINDLATTWKAHMPPRFSGLPIGASKPMLGVKADSKEVLDALIRTGEVQESKYVRSDIPEHFDSAENWPHCADMINDIRDQSNCGCCWAFGSAEAASDRMCIASNGQMKMPLSAQDLCFNSNFNGCGGGQPASAWSYIKRTGIVTGGQFNGTGPFGSGWCSAYSLPHCHHHGPQGNDPYPAEGQPGCPSQRSPRGPTTCDANANATAGHADFANDKYSFDGAVTHFRSEKAIQTAIMTDGPVTTAFDVYSDFENYEHGVYRHVTGRSVGGHAVKIVGWGVDKQTGTPYWKVANSWNPTWGEEGYFRILRGENECNIEAQAVASSTGSLYAKKL